MAATSPTKTMSQKDEEEKEEQIPISQQYAYLSRIGTEFGEGLGFLQVAAWVSTIFNGALMPAFAYNFQQILDNLAGSPPDKIVERATETLIFFIVLGVLMFLATALQFGLWGAYGGTIAARIRKRYLQALLIQDISYHELTGSGTVNQRLGTNAHAIGEGVGMKLGFGIQQFCTFIAGFSLAFYYSWLMTLVLIACLPVLIIVGVLQGLALGGKSGVNADPFLESGAVSQEILTNVRTVYAFPKLVKLKQQQYIDVVHDAYPLAKKRAMILGFGMGAMFFGIIGVCDAVGLWYGTTQVADGHLTIGVMFGCFFGFFMGGSALGQVGSVFEDIAGAAMAAAHVFQIFDRKPVVRPPDQGRQPIASGSIEGAIEFRNVSFAYPTDPDRKVITRLNVAIEAGKTLAIVGPSGSGKSTIVNLIERYYDPIEGDLLIDGVPIHNYDMKFLRGQMSLVSQTPLLFNETIRENIRAGNADVSMEEIEAAARKANAHDFIMALEKGYDTMVGELGGRLSGGQRQRISVARALLKQPKVLLLDEATSALDSKSEEEVQAALDYIRETEPLTMIVIAHRLSTVRNADKILVLVDGDVDSLGSHDELMDQDGLYAALVRAQQLVVEHDDEEHSVVGSVVDLVRQPSNEQPGDVTSY